MASGIVPILAVPELSWLGGVLPPNRTGGPGAIPGKLK